uniref:Uncharacterized protein n=1 Tax=Romanomermis culicivorax TaxID=13658 RepID=A0A915IFG1_ROMCU
MPDVLETKNIDGEVYVVGVPKSYNEKKLNNVDLSKDTRRYDGIITGRTVRKKLWQCMINPPKQVRDHFICKDDQFGFRMVSNDVSDLNQVFAWKADLDNLYESYAKRRASKLRIYTSRELLDLAPLKTRMNYKRLAEKAAKFIRDMEASTSASS